jgi:hypothetical protein
MLAGIRLDHHEAPAKIAETGTGDRLTMPNVDNIGSNLPNFFIVGVMKGGTTSLAKYLAAHPDVFMSPVKEPHHFCKDIRIEDFRPDYRRSVEFDIRKYLSQPMLEEKHVGFFPYWEQYVQLFRDTKGETAIGEASVGYLYSSVAASEIAKKLPYAKIVISLRNPVERAYSHFMMDLATGDSKHNDFRQAIDDDFSSAKKGWGVSSLYIEAGLYHTQVKRYLDFFGQANVKIVLYDDLVSKPCETVRDIYDFLGVDSSFISPVLTEKFNVSSGQKYPELNRFLKQNPLAVSLKKYLPASLRSTIKSRYLLSNEQRKITKSEREYAFTFFESDIAATASLINHDLTGWHPSLAHT